MHAFTYHQYIHYKQNNLGGAGMFLVNTRKSSDSSIILSSWSLSHLISQGKQVKSRVLLECAIHQKHNWIKYACLYI